MAWTIEIQESAKKELKKLDKPVLKRIFDVLDRIASLDDPRTAGHALKGSILGDFWRYRVGDFRLICRVEDNRLVITLVRVGHRKEVYK